jgi:hypothetical protein
MKLLTTVLNLSFGQNEVDFVVPNLEQDRRLCIDPILLYKAKNAELRTLHSKMLQIFNYAIEQFEKGNRKDAEYLIDFPEASEIGLGYAVGTTKGSGLGSYLNKLVFDTLTASPDLVERKLKHIEELQLVSLGISADRVSDITANILKDTLIQYTKRQCELWNIPMSKGVPITHILNFRTLEWEDRYEDLPTNPYNGTPLIFVPRRIVRILPWINFEDYLKLEFMLFLPSKKKLFRKRKEEPIEKELPSKSEVVDLTRKEIHRIDRYVAKKEKQADEAQPISLVSDRTIDIQQLIEELQALKNGREDAYKYQNLILKILNYLFEPELIDGKPQVRTEYGTEIRDIIYTNESDISFWRYIRNNHKNFLVIFELKNKDEIDNTDIDQLANYLGDPTGYLGILISRKTPKSGQSRKAFAIYNKVVPRKIILFLSDDEIKILLKEKNCGKDPTKIIQNKYRNFMTLIE